jgi:hypothetical protein
MTCPTCNQFKDLAHRKTIELGTAIDTHSLTDVKQKANELANVTASIILHTRHHQEPRTSLQSDSLAGLTS